MRMFPSVYYKWKPYSRGSVYRPILGVVQLKLAVYAAGRIFIYRWMSHNSVLIETGLDT